MVTAESRNFIAKCLYTFPTCGGVWSALSTLERTQWLPAKRLREIQLRRLEALLAHAHKTVPYYRSFDSKIFEISNLDDLQKLPILTRRQVRQHFGRLQSVDGPSGRIVMSSGSTGLPVTVRKSPLTVRMESAARYRAYRWVGFDFGQRYGYMTPAFRAPWTLIRPLLAGMLLPGVSIDVFNIDWAKLARFVRYLELKPTVLIGNPSALLLLARFIDEIHARPMVRLIISGSDQLFSAERTRLASAFGARVYDYYGSYEIGNIAAECREMVGHHIASENVVVEIVGADRDAVPTGQIGSVVITDLNNYTMPLIRYEIGDLSSLLDDECPCGRELPLLGKVEGRVTDVIVTPDGRFMCLSTFGNRVLYRTHVEQFQIDQSSKYELIVRAILASRWRKMEGEFIQHGIQSIVGDQMKVRVEFPEVLETRPSGKRYLVRSTLDPRITDQRNI